MAATRPPPNFQMGLKQLLKSSKDEENLQETGLESLQFYPKSPKCALNELAIDYILR